jgi:Flp pilus assembly secretin CpaC
MRRLPLKHWLLTVLCLALGLVVSGRAQDEAVRPKRIYVNVSESEKLTFPEPIDSTTVSITKVVKLQQPNDTTLLIEALEVGRTTVTVTLRSGALERYFVSTFENRGADLLSIQNQFTEKGYKLLKIAFEKDQAVLSGSVATQEELDDAVKIVKRFSPYVNVKATLGQVSSDLNEINEDEALVINNIQRIAQVSGLIVKVKFPPIAENITSVTSRFSGDRFQNITTSRSDSAGRVTDNRLEFPGQTAGAGGGGAAGNAASAEATQEKRPLENALETVTRTENKSLPEKIFLSGTVDSDIEKARAIRVARTFCPLVVSFINIRDPIQVRIDLSIVEVNLTKSKDLGLRWTDNSGTSSPSAGIGTTYNAAGTTGGVFDNVLNKLTYGLQFNAKATLNLLEQTDSGRVLQQPSIFLSNGQPGYFFVGDEIPYVAGFTTVSGTVNNQTIPQIEFVPVGVSIFIVPLNYERASQHDGEKLSIVDDKGRPRIPSLGEIKRLENQVDLTTPPGITPKRSEVDDNIKYVDENGLVGINIESTVSTLNTAQPFVKVTNEISVPRVASRSLYSRLYLKDQQSCVVSGLFDDSTTNSIRKLPGLADIPLLGWLFTNPSTKKDRLEILFVYTPTVQRTSGAPVENLIPRPRMPETDAFMKQLGMNKTKFKNKTPFDAGMPKETPPAMEVPSGPAPMKSEPAPASVRDVPVQTKALNQGAALSTESAPASSPSIPLPEMPLSKGSGDSFYPPLMQQGGMPATQKPYEFPNSNTAKPGVTSELKLRKDDETGTSQMVPNPVPTPTTILRQNPPAQPVIDIAPPATDIPVPASTDTGPATPP